jgi:hypothetical protein
MASSRPVVWSPGVYHKLRHASSRDAKSAKLLDQVTAQKETFDELVVLAFPVQLQPGRNDFHFTVLDEATIPVHGDPRPLLVFLRHITVKSSSGLR